MYVREIVQDDSTRQCSFTQQCFGKHKRRMVTAFLVTTLGVINYQFSDVFYKF